MNFEVIMMQEETVLATPVVQEDLLHRFFKSVWFLILPGYILLTSIIAWAFSSQMYVAAKAVMESVMANLQSLGQQYVQEDISTTFDVSPSTFILLVAIAVIIYDAFKLKRMRKTPFQVIKVLYYISFAACIIVGIVFAAFSSLLSSIGNDEGRMFSLFFMGIFALVAIYAIFSFLIARFARGIEFYITNRSLKLPGITGLVALCVLFAAAIVLVAMQVPNLPLLIPSVLEPSSALTWMLNYLVIMLYIQAGSFVVAIVSLFKFRSFANEIGA